MAVVECLMLVQSVLGLSVPEFGVGRSQSPLAHWLVLAEHWGLELIPELVLAEANFWRFQVLVSIGELACLEEIVLVLLLAQVQ